MRFVPAIAFLGALFALLAPLSARADIQVVPVSLTIPRTEHVGAFTVRNDSNEAVQVQAKIFAWSQPDGIDTQTAMDAALIVPPVFSIPAYGQQIVRFGLRNVVPGPAETAYRVVFSQLPQKPIGSNAGLAILFAFNIPVFLDPSGRRYSDIAWSLVHQSGTHYILKARNNGTVHSQFRSIHLVDAGGNIAGTINAPGYLLAQTTRSWPFEMAPGVRAEAVNADAVAGTIHAALTAAP